MTFIAAVVLLAAVILFLLYLRPQDVPDDEPVSPVAHLEERKARIYEGLRDLQFEYRLGKLSDEDYQRTKLDLQKQLASVLAEIDRISAGLAPLAPPSPAKTPLAASTATVNCPKCGAEFGQHLKFCGECGAPLRAGERA